MADAATTTMHGRDDALAAALEEEAALTRVGAGGGRLLQAALVARSIYGDSLVCGSLVCAGSD